MQTFHSEFVHPGKSPLECLVECFSDLSTQLNNSTEKQDTLPPYRDYVSLTGSRLADTLTLLEETLSLAWILLGHGAEHDIRDETRKTPLHNTLLRSRDTRLAEVLCDNGADVNTKDLFGNTPLMALCSWYPWGSSSAFGPCLASEASAKWSYEAARFILKQPGSRINERNKKDRTALFLAMQAHNWPLAKLLLDAGADPTIHGQSPSAFDYISPLLCALIPWQSSSSCNLLTIISLVEEGYFQTANVIDELLDGVYSSEDKQLKQLRRFGSRLVPLLFGMQSCSLIQLCCRRLLELFVSPPNLMTCFKGVQGIEDIRTHHLERLLSTLGAPMDLLAQMQIALLRQRIRWILSQQDWSEDSDVSSDGSERESDGEYW